MGSTIVLKPQRLQLANAHEAEQFRLLLEDLMQQLDVTYSKESSRSNQHIHALRELERISLQSHRTLLKCILRIYF